MWGKEEIDLDTKEGFEKFLILTYHTSPNDFPLGNELKEKYH